MIDENAMDRSVRLRIELILEIDKIAPTLTTLAMKTVKHLGDLANNFCEFFQ